MMNTIKTILLNMVLPIISALPIERIVAMYLNKMLDKISPANIDKARTTARHLGELSELFDDILDDEMVTEEELTGQELPAYRASVDP